MSAQPLLLERGGQHRFALLYRPSQKVRAALLLLPPFAEELNKTRRALCQAAHAFAEAGFAVLQIDPLGCGDSAGDFSDASWTAWLQDFEQLGVGLLDQEFRGVPRLAWGVRAGCLLASTLAPHVEAQLWWQPSPQGRAVLQQFLRLRMAAELDSAERISVAALKAELAAGHAVEVAGYLLAPELAAGIEAATLHPPEHPALWLEASSQQPPQLLPGSQQWLQQKAPPAIKALALESPAPWNATELEDCPALVEASLCWLNERWPAQGAAA